MNFAIWVATRAIPILRFTGNVIIVLCFSTEVVKKISFVLCLKSEVSSRVTSIAESDLMTFRPHLYNSSDYAILRLSRMEKGT